MNHLTKLIDALRTRISFRKKHEDGETVSDRRFSPLPPRRILLLGVVGTGVFAVTLWQNFPHHQAARFVLREISQGGGVGIEARQARFDFPARVEYSNLDMVAATPDGPVNLQIDRATGHLELASLVKRKPRFNFRLKAYGGEFEGLLRHLPKQKNHLQGSTVRPLNLGLTRPLFHQDLSGSMTLKTDYTWQSGSETTGHGVFSAAVAHLVLKSLNLGGFPLPPITFDTVRSQVFLSGGRGRLEQLTASGPLANVSGGGTFLLAQPYPNSILHLKLLVSLKGPLGSIPIPSFSGAGGKSVTVTLDGPASNLNIAMNGIPIPH